MICAICGQPIIGNGTKDHIYPQEIAKWSHSEQVSRAIGNRANKAMTHRECNYHKQDTMPDLDALYIQPEQKEKLAKVMGRIPNYVNSHLEKKNALISSQNHRCFWCDAELNDAAILRRIDPKRFRSWDNACVVCRQCNDERHDFVRYSGRPIPER